MRLTYFSYTRFPSEKAHALYLAKVAESVVNSQSGHLFTIVVPRRFGAARTSPQEYYGLSKSVTWQKIFCIDLLALPILKKPAFYIGQLSFALSAIWYAARNCRGDDARLITNDVLVAYMLGLFFSSVIFELHDYPAGSRWLYRQVFRRVWKIQTNNQQKLRLLTSDFSVPSDKMFALPNGVTVSQFDISESQRDARSALSLVPGALAVYTGHLYDWKGADIFAAAAALLPEVQFLFVGGTKKDLEKFKAAYTNPNITFAGHQPHAAMPLYLRAADVLVLPNTAKKDISRLHTSPMKVFEYMASRTPIVASNIPSITEILKPETAVLFEPDNPQALADAITEVLRNTAVATERATVAFDQVSGYSWGARSEKLLEHIQ